MGSLARPDCTSIRAARLLDTYVQRNALVVGFVMGFAIIPIIYTIAEDALSSVPEHCARHRWALGATPWQTATRIIIPTAMSGLFSALMIGLGRAVGETMIVLMAAGNTPIMEWNIFNGFRTLSANIAIELPEAAARQHALSHAVSGRAGAVCDDVSREHRGRGRAAAFPPEGL